MQYFMFVEQNWGDLTPAGEVPSSLHRHDVVPQQQPAQQSQFGSSTVNSWGNELWEVQPNAVDDKVCEGGIGARAKFII